MTFAQQQFPVPSEFAEKTANMEGAEDCHRYCRATAAGMKRLLERA